MYLNPFLLYSTLELMVEINVKGFIFTLSKIHHIFSYLKKEKCTILFFKRLILNLIIILLTYLICTSHFGTIMDAHL